jgi:hypothetical protein
MFGSTNPAPPPQKKLANVDADQLSTNQQAIAVRYIAGWSRVALHYIAPGYNHRKEKITATTGKNQTSTVGYNHYEDMAGILCLGEIDRIQELIFDSNLEWDGDITADSDPYEPITVTDRGLFRLYWGRDDQPVDTLVLTPISTTYPDPGVYPDFDPRKTGTWPDGDYTQRQP